MTRLDCYCHRSLGDVCYEIGDYISAQALYENSLQFYRLLDEKNGIALALASLGNVANQSGNYTAARNLYEKSLEVFKQSGNQEEWQLY